MRLALAAPGHAEVAEGLLEILARMGRGRRRPLRRRGVGATTSWRERPDRVVVATGADPYLPALGGDGRRRRATPGRRSRALAVGERVLVSDWGGDWTGLDTAEALAARGAEVRLVTSAVAFGEGVHQYQRNLYLARLDDAGVELRHHLRPVARGAGLGRRSRTSSPGAAGRDRRRRHARRERRPHGRRRPLPRAGARPACRSSGPATARARARSRRRSARARWPASGRETSVPGTNVSRRVKHWYQVQVSQPVSTWRGRAAPRSIGSIGVQTASSPQPGQ